MSGWNRTIASVVGVNGTLPCASTTAPRFGDVGDRDRDAEPAHVRM